MPRQDLNVAERDALRQLGAPTRETVDQAMIENLSRKGLIKPSALGGYALKIEGRAALRAAA